MQVLDLRVDPHAEDAPGGHAVEAGIQRVVIDVERTKQADHKANEANGEKVKDQQDEAKDKKH